MTSNIKQSDIFSVGLSAVVICLNEQSNIERCLRSLSWVDEIIVYDSGSKDSTVEIAKKMGAKVYEGDWLGFGSTKYKATSLASHDWVLSLDADEEVPEKLKNEIQKALSQLDSQVLYKIPRMSYYMQRWIKHGGWYPDRQARLFNKNFYQWNQEPIHEQIIALPTLNQSLKTETLQNYMHHYVFKNIEHQVSTNNRYSSLQAQKMFKEGRQFSVFHFLTKPYVKFIECYFLKLGFLDGWPGYVIARNAAYSVFLKWIKLKEFYDAQK